MNSKRSFSKRLGIIIIWVLGITLSIPVLLASGLFVILKIKCGASVYWTYHVTGTNWVMEEHGPGCYFGGTYPFDLTARNLINGEVLTVATGDVGVIEIQSLPGKVILRLPNRSWVNTATNEFGGIKVVYNYQPHDDPADRAAYRLWVKESKNIENRRWYCSNVYPSLSPEVQRSINQDYAPDQFNASDAIGSVSNSFTPYCPAP